MLSFRMSQNVIPPLRRAARESSLSGSVIGCGWIDRSKEFPAGATHRPTEPFVLCFRSARVPEREQASQQQTALAMSLV